MGKFGQDGDGVFKLLDDGRVLRVQQRMFNSTMTVSSSQEDQGWLEAW
jgi:hypothetical protein